MHAPQEDDSRYEAYFVLDGTRVCLEEGDELDWKLFRAKVDKVESVHVLLPAWPVLGLFYWGGEGAPLCVFLRTFFYSVVCHFWVILRCFFLDFL